MAQSKKPKPLPFYLTIFAGAIAGAVELLVLYPSDVVKTRAQQLTSGSTPIIQSFKDLWQEGGLLRLYRGILPPLMVEPIKRAVKFTANDFGNNFFFQHISPNYEGTNMKAAICGAFAGASEAAAIAPFEVVKVRLQAKNRVGFYQNTFDCAKKMYQQEGVLGFSRGLASALQRNGTWNCVYFGIINVVKGLLPAPQSYTQTLGVNFMAGFWGGVFACLANTPFDVVCSRVRNVLPGETSPYKFTYPSMLFIARHEGPHALWKGFLVKVLRLGPGGGILLVVFEMLKQFFTARIQIQ